MTIQINFPFTTPGNYTFNASKIEVAAGVARLILGAGPTQEKDSPFTTPGNYLYDNAKIEVSGGFAKLKRLPALDATFYASYDTSFNANFGEGSLVGTPVGAPVITGNQLDLTGGTVKYVDYLATANADSQQAGAIRFDLTPNYTGAPAATRRFFSISQAAGSANNQIMIEHRSSGGGQLWIYVKSSAGANIVSVNLGVWSPTALQKYEFELNFEITTGSTFLHIDGVQFGATQTGTGTRSSSIALLRVGSGESGTTASNFLIDNFVYFNQEQHSSGSSWSVPSPSQPLTKYDITDPTIELSTHEISLTPGAIYSIVQFIEVISVSGGDAVKYQLSNDGGSTWEFWNGVIWTAASGFAQSNTVAELNTGAGLFDFSGGLIRARAILHSNLGTTTPSLDNFKIQYKLNEFPQDNPTISTSTFNAGELETFSHSASIPGSDAIKYQIQVNGVEYYWTGSAWSVAVGYAQSNTVAEITANISTLLDGLSDKTIRIIAFIHSDTGASTPELDSVSIQYQIFVPTEAAPDRCVIYGTFLNSLGQPEEGVDVIAKIEGPAEIDAKNIRVKNLPVITTTDSLGKWQLDLIRSSEYNPDSNYLISFKKRGNEAEYTITVPDAASAEINDLI